MAAKKKSERDDASPDASEFEREAAELSYEAALAELEAIIERVEHGSIGLEESLREYRRGRALLKRCESVLATAETEIKRLTLADAEAAANAAGRQPS
ncbi:MAG: exodeoxyribonuclease VII small subunit [Phycisphaerae bacterium]|nr:exodeoxyribonuclease VII small subunit [Phycisphaerae bacterium]